MKVSSPIFRMFGRSPIRPLKQHMATVHDCCEKLLPLIDAGMDNRWDDAEEIYNEIAELEKVADDQKRDLRLNLPKSLFLPVARSDVLELITMQDRIANKAKDLGGLITSRRMVLSQDMADNYVSLLKLSIEASNQARKAINELDELLETGFANKEVELVESMIVKLNELEHATDEMQAILRHQLFEAEKDLPAVDVIFRYKMIEWAGDLADRAQTVGDRLQIMLAD